MLRNGNTNRFYIIVISLGLLIAVCISIITAVIVIDNKGQTDNLAKATLDRCITTNKARVENRAMWTAVVALLGSEPTSDQALLNTIRENLKLLPLPDLDCNGRPG